MFSFRLNDEFVDQYRPRPVPWGFSDVAGNSFSELTFIDKYSRVKADGSKETWVDVCQRVTNGTYSIQKDHAKTNRLPWNDHKAQRSAQEFFDRMFHFKFTPPGRGLWVMGTELVNVQRNSAALQNCAFVSTKGMSKLDPAAPFRFLMEASMLGVGVGFDTLGTKKGFVVHDVAIPVYPTCRLDIDGRALPPSLNAKNNSFERVEYYPIPDTRQGWVDSMAVVINAFLKGGSLPAFDYSAIRPKGAVIRTFGGTAAGPVPLWELHDKLIRMFAGRADEPLTSLDIVDIGNLIGTCVVSGNVRRSAELALGEDGDELFMSAKDPDVNPVRTHYCPADDDGNPIPHFWVDGSECPGGRPGWGYMSNNSIAVKVGTDYQPYVENIALNGEPGFAWMDITRDYGRIIDGPDGKDWRVDGYNPCAEQPLEGGHNGQGECCTLVETYLPRHETLDDFKRTLKFAYLYAKTVTLLPTHWDETNSIMQRNRRIGTSISGVAQFADNKGMSELKTYVNQGFDTIRYYDRKYSEWLCVRESIRVTTVKPSGTVSLLAGVTPGAHWMPGGQYFLRAQRFDKDSPIVEVLRTAGYTVEADVTDAKRRVVAYFPVHHPGARAERDVTMWEKAMLAVTLQRYWSDNSVSVTVSFDPVTEGPQIGNLLRAVEGQLKTVSFLPKGNKVYPQQPYTEITQEEYEEYAYHLFPVDFALLYLPEHARQALGEAYCTTDVCEVPA